jgi:hypothetical protein
MGALFLAGKVDETFRKIWDIAHIFISIFKVLLILKYKIIYE